MCNGLFSSSRSTRNESRPSNFTVLLLTHMEFLTYQLRDKFPSKVASALANRFVASTIKQYQSHWKMFLRYYREEIAYSVFFRNMDALFFLLKLLQKGAANRTLSVVKAALYGWNIDITALEYNQLSMYFLFGRQRL